MSLASLGLGGWVRDEMNSLRGVDFLPAFSWIRMLFSRSQWSTRGTKTVAVSIFSSSLWVVGVVVVASIGHNAEDDLLKSHSVDIECQLPVRS